MDKEQKQLLAKQKKRLYNTEYSKKKYNDESNIFKVRELLRYYKKKFNEKDDEISDIFKKEITDDFTQHNKLYEIKLVLFNRQNNFLLKKY